MPFAGWGGSEQQFVASAKVLKALGIKYTIVTSDRVTKDPMFSFYDRIGPTYALEFDRRFQVDVDEFQDVVNIENPDLIHVQRPGGEGLPYYLVPHFSNVPIVLTTLCDRDEGNVRWATTHIVPSKHVLQLQTNEHPNRFIVHHSVTFPDLSSVDVPPLINSLRDSYDKIAIRIGTIDSTKRILDSIQAVRDHPNTALIVGGRDIYGYWERTCRKSEFLAGNVFWVSEVSTEAKFSLLAHSDYALYPTSKEAFGIVFIESMYCGLPIVTYDNGANKEVIGPAGIFVPDGDVDQLADVVGTITREEIYCIREIAEQRAESYSPERQALSLRRIYNEALHG